MGNATRWLIFGLALLSPGAAQSERILTNQDILEQVQRGIAEAEMLEAIDKQQVHFETSADALIALKSAGLSDHVVLAVLAAARRNVTLKPVVPPGALPAGPGVYLLREGQYIDIPPERFTWRRPAAESFFRGLGIRGPEAEPTLGRMRLLVEVLTWRDFNGSLPGPKSRTVASATSEFLIVCPEEAIGAEYRLVRIDQKSGARVFSVLVQFVAKAYFGLADPRGSRGRVMNTAAEKVTAHTYRVRLPEVKRGQYGFLQPGTIEHDLAGAIHPFELR